MDEKKESANWKIAAGHAFKSIFLMPLLFVVITIYPLIIATQIISWKVIKGNEKSLAFELSMIMMIAIWVGVRWSAKRIEKKNIVRDSGKIINISLVIVVVVFVLDRLSKILKPGGMESVDIIYTFTSVLMIFVFYIASKKYIKNSSDAIAS